MVTRLSKIKAGGQNIAICAPTSSKTGHEDKDEQKVCALYLHGILRILLEHGDRALVHAMTCMSLVYRMGLLASRKRRWHSRAWNGLI